jgi:hypothetical protein
MRLLTRTEFLQLPAGVIYFKGKEWYFEGLAVKEESVEHSFPDSSGDWFYVDPAWIEAHDSGEAFERLDAMKAGASYPMQETMCRDGLFERDDIFLVPERDDLLKLREWIDRAITANGY